MWIFFIFKKFMLSFATEKLRTRLQKMAFDSSINKVSVISFQLPSGLQGQSSLSRSRFRSQVRDLMT